MRPKVSHVARLLRAGLALAASAGLASAQSGRSVTLGPKDGAGLSPLDTGRVAPGTAAPDFTLQTKDGGTVTLSQFRGKKNVVLVFYRGYW